MVYDHMSLHLHIVGDYFVANYYLYYMYVLDMKK